jgi:hypothetical protein
MTMKTEDYPLSRSSIHDTDFTSAQLMITRDADGRHRIGQIIYKSEENLPNPLISCPQHHTNPSSPTTKIRSARGTGQCAASFIQNSRLLSNIDQDNPSYTTSSSTETKRSSSISNHDIPSNYSYSSMRKTTTESISRQSNDKTSRSQDRRKESSSTKTRSAFTELMIDNIDDYITPNLVQAEQDFDLSDIEDVMQIRSKSTHDANDDDDTTNMDEDSLESCQGVIEKQTSTLFSSPILSNSRPSMMSRAKPGGYCTALYLAQKQKQTSMRQPSTPFISRRSLTLPNVNPRTTTTTTNNQQLNSRSSSQQKTLTDTSDPTASHDMSKLDRDSGFDEHDFRCERLHSGGDEDNSSVSSVQSVRSSQTHSVSSDIHHHIYRENKAYELRLKALDYTRVLNEQSVQDGRMNMRRNFNYALTRTNDMNYPMAHKFKKHHQSNLPFQQ